MVILRSFLRYSQFRGHNGSVLENLHRKSHGLIIQVHECAATLTCHMSCRLMIWCELFFGYSTWMYVRFVHMCGTPVYTWHVPRTPPPYALLIWINSMIFFLFSMISSSVNSSSFTSPSSFSMGASTRWIGCTNNPWRKPTTANAVSYTHLTLPTILRV